MQLGAGAAWAFTVVFGLLAALSLLALRGEWRRPLTRVGGVLHVLMCLAMVAMQWPWSAAVPAPVWIVVFTAAALWFGALAVLQLSGRLPRRALGGHGAGQQVGHLVMMLAMVWMAAMSAGHGSGGGHELAPGGLGAGLAATAGLLAAGALMTADLVSCRAALGRWTPHAQSLAAGAGMSLAMAAACWTMLPE